MCRSTFVPSRNRPSVTHCHASHLVRPRGFSPPRRFAPRDGFGCFATQAGWGSPRCWFHRPPPSGKPRPGGTRVEPFPRRGHPSKNLPRRQPETTSRWPRALSRFLLIQCGPESPSQMRGPPQGFTPSTLLDLNRLPLPAPDSALVLPWASILAALQRPKPLPPANCDVKERFRDDSPKGTSAWKRLLGQIGRAHV